MITSGFESDRRKSVNKYMAVNNIIGKNIKVHLNRSK